MKYLFAILSVILAAVTAMANEGETQHAGIPREVYLQALNFFGLLAILFFVLRKKVSGHFQERHRALSAAIVEAKKQREAAEKQQREYTAKIDALKQETQTILNQMKRDGEDAKKRIIEEANKMAAAIAAEAKRTVENEMERVREELYDELLNQSLDGARTLLKKSVAENDQKRLQKEFVEKIEAVQ